jgi:hypothetical protein
MTWTVTDDPREHDLEMDESLRDVFRHANSDLAWNRNVGEIEVPDLLRAFCVLGFLEMPRLVRDQLANFRPTSEEMIEALKANFPGTKNLRGGKRFGKGAWDTVLEAGKIAGDAKISAFDLFLALLKRNDVLQVLERTGYSDEEVRLLRDRAIDRWTATSLDQRLLPLRRKRVFVVPAMPRDHEMVLRNLGISYQYFLEPGIRAGGIAFTEYSDLMRACSVMQMKPLAFTIVGGTETQEVQHVVLQPDLELLGWRAPEYRAEMNQFAHTTKGDGCNPTNDGEEALSTLLIRRLTPVVQRDLKIIGNVNPHDIGPRVDDSAKFSVLLHISSGRLEEALAVFETALSRSGVMPEYSRAQINLSETEIASATRHAGEPGTLCARAVIVHNAMYVQVSKALYQDDGSRMIVLDMLMRKCAEHMRTQGTALDRFLADLPDDGLPLVENARVEVSGFVGSPKRLMSKLVERVLARGRLCWLQVENCGGALRDPPRFPLDFQILYNAKPSWNRGHVPSGTGVPILNDTGEVVAELFERGLFIYSDMVRTGSMKEAETLAQCLIAARRLRMAGATEDERRQTISQQYVDEALRQFTPGARSDTDLASVEQRLTEMAHRARELEDRVARNEDLAETELAHEFDSLLEVEKVKNVRVTRTELIVETDVIHCVDPRSGRTHRIGDFHIHIPLAGDGVKFMNQTGTITADDQAHHAPHVGPSGSPCLGNIKDLLPGMIQRRELVPAVQLCIAFLESVNTDDLWGKHVNKWPVERQEATAEPRPRRSTRTERPRDPDDEPLWRPARDRGGYQY